MRAVLRSICQRLPRLEGCRRVNRVGVVRASIIGSDRVLCLSYASVRNRLSELVLKLTPRACFRVRLR